MVCGKFTQIKKENLGKQQNTSFKCSEAAGGLSKWGKI